MLYSFVNNGADGTTPYARLVNVKGTLYGTTFYGGNACDCGTVFSIDPVSGKEAVLHSFGDSPDGANPFANLINLKGTLYGVTYLGGKTTNCGGHGCGTVFSIKP